MEYAPVTEFTHYYLVPLQEQHSGDKKRYNTNG